MNPEKKIRQVEHNPEQKQQQDPLVHRDVNLDGIRKASMDRITQVIAEQGQEHGAQRVADLRDRTTEARAQFLDGGKASGQHKLQALREKYLSKDKPADQE